MHGSCWPFVGAAALRPSVLPVDTCTANAGLTLTLTANGILQAPRKGIENEGILKSRSDMLVTIRIKGPPRATPTTQDKMYGHPRRGRSPRWERVEENEILKRQSAKRDFPFLKFALSCHDSVSQENRVSLGARSRSVAERELALSSTWMNTTARSNDISSKPSTVCEFSQLTRHSSQYPQISSQEVVRSPYPHHRPIWVQTLSPCILPHHDPFHHFQLRL